MNVMWCRECKLYYWTKANKVKVQLNRIQVHVRADNGFTKTFITPCTPKRWCYGFTADVDVLTVYIKNVLLIYRYISLLFNFNNFYYDTFDSLMEDFLQCKKKYL